MTARLIGISGYATAGKDSIADHLVAAHGFVKVSWADKLREAALALDPILGARGDRWGHQVRYSELLEVCGYDAAKAHPVYGPEFRRTLIRLGTEVGRNVFGEDFWVDLLMNSLDPGGRYVIPDTRFENEAAAIQARGGELWRVTRPGVGPAMDHPSETSHAGWDFDAEFSNSGTLAYLAAGVDVHMREAA